MYTRNKMALYIGITLCIAVMCKMLIASTQSELKEFIMEGIRSNESLIHNFETRFSINFLGPNGEPKQADPNKPREITKMDYYYVRGIQDGDKIFSKYEVYNAVGLSQDVTIGFDGTTTKFYRADLSEGLITVEKRYPTPAGPDRFTNLYRNVRDLTMSKFLEQSTIKRIEPCEVEGHQGFLVEVIHCDSSERTPMEQKIYFDVERGFVPVKVETFRLDLSQEEPVMVCTVLEFKKLDNDIYFPVRARLDNFRKGEDGHMKKTFGILCMVKDIKTNIELPADIFKVEYPPGTEVYDSFADISYVVGETEGALARIESFVEKQHVPNDKSFKTQPKGTVQQAIQKNTKEPLTKPLAKISEEITKLQTGVESKPRSIFFNWLFWLIGLVTAVLMVVTVVKLQQRKVA